MTHERCGTDAENDLDLGALLREVNETTRFFDPPDEPGLLAEADPGRLDRHGIPPKPNPDTHPEHCAFWKKMFAPPLRFETADFSFQASGIQLNPRDRLSSYGSRREASANWSGVYVTPKQGRMFTAVHGSWYVPEVSITEAADEPPAVGEYRSSTWIGLDGQRRYRNSTLPQIGTAQFVELVDGRPVRTTKAWWQWWMRGQRRPPVTLPLKVSPGDLVMCSVIVTERGTVRFFIKNQTTGRHVRPFERHPPAPGITVSGATAEWIMERPTHLHSDKLYPLPDYGTVRFGDCIAIAANAPGEPGREQSLRGAKLIDMYDVREHPHRRADISVARWKGERSVAAAFR